MTPLLRLDPLLGLLHLLGPQSIPLLFDPLLGLLLLDPLLTPLLLGQLLRLVLFLQPQVALGFHPLLLKLPIFRLLGLGRGRPLLQSLSCQLLILAVLCLLAILLLLCALLNVVVFHGDSCAKDTDCTRLALCGNAHSRTIACTADSHLVSSTCP
jgi:hypothetical protein